MQHLICKLGETISVIDEKKQIMLVGSPLTSIGQVRHNNEDNVQLWVLGEMMLGLVADGMGGAAGGEEASRLAVETVQTDFVDSMPDDLPHEVEEQISQKLRDVLNRANQVVLDRAAEHYELTGMGTTATMVLVHATEAIFAHIGDSRAYVVEGTTQQITQITEDHSFVEALLASGHITPEQAEIHPLRNVLYRALGQKDEADTDVEIYTRKLKVDDRLILCSDGLPRHIKNHEIASIAISSEQPDVIGQQLIDLANERGGEDNISVVVIVVKQK